MPKPVCRAEAIVDSLRYPLIFGQLKLGMATRVTQREGAGGCEGLSG